MIICVFLLLSSACSVDPGAANLYRQSRPLEVEMILPESLSPDQQQVIKVSLTQGEEKVDAADIRFEIWKKESKENPEVIKARHDEDGIYVAEKTFAEDGLYYIKADVRARDLHVMPAKQVIVGELTEEEIQSLQPESDQHYGEHGHH